MFCSERLPEALRKQVADKLSEFRKDLKMWNSMRTSFASKLQEWDMTPSAPEDSSKKQLFPAAVDTSAETAVVVREKLNAELNSIVNNANTLLGNLESTISDLKQETGNFRTVCHE